MYILSEIRVVLFGEIFSLINICDILRKKLVKQSSYVLNNKPIPVKYHNTKVYSTNFEKGEDKSRIRDIFKPRVLKQWSLRSTIKFSERGSGQEQLGHFFHK